MLKDDLVARLPSYPWINRHFALVCTALAPAFGSLVTLVYHGGAIWCVLAVLSGRIPLSRDRQMIAMTIAIYAFALVNVGSTLVNSGAHDLEALVPVAALLGFPFSYAIWSVARKEDIAWGAIFGSSVGCVSALAVAIVQFHISGIRAEGGAGNALVFATVLALLTPVSLAGMFVMDTRWRRPLAAATVAGALALMYSGSRIAWLAAAMALLVVCWVHRRAIRASLSARTVKLLILVLFLVGVVAVIPVAERIEQLMTDWREFAVSGNYSTSLGLRAALWHIGIDLVREAPFIGHGQVQTADLIGTGLREKFGQERVFSHFHNGFLTAAVETGILGVAALASIFAIAMGTGVRVLRASSDGIERFGALMLLSASIVYLVVGFANIMLGHDILDTMFLISMAVGMLLAGGRARPYLSAASAAGPAAAEQS